MEFPFVEIFIFTSIIDPLYLDMCKMCVVYYDLFKISVSLIESLLTKFVCNKKLSTLTQSPEICPLSRQIFEFFLKIN